MDRLGRKLFAAILVLGLTILAHGLCSRYEPVESAFVPKRFDRLNGEYQRWECWGYDAVTRQATDCGWHPTSEP